MNGFPLYSSGSAEQVHSSDTLNFDATGALSSIGPTASTASYQSQDSFGECYSRQLASKDRVLTEVKDGVGCPTRR